LRQAAPTGLSAILFEVTAMGEFSIKVARIEAERSTGRQAKARVTFKIDHQEAGFLVPVVLSLADFDDTELVEAARDTLRRTFVELARECERWELTPQKLEQLSRSSLRPKETGD
jgi:hypothetical protein